MRHAIQLLQGVLAFFIFGVEAHGSPVIIDWTNAVAASSASSTSIQEAAALRWFFAHASVGDNICDGLTVLNSANPSVYTLLRSSEDGIPPAGTQSGRFYDYERGNPSWQVKFDSFGDYVSNGWAYPKIDVAANKLCWIDQDADASQCITKMQALESAFPNTIFVYFTMPLDAYEEYQNKLRNDYNNTLRAWVRANNRILFDIADIESHTPDGTPVTFSYGGQSLAKLYSGYTSDGGHLNDAGKQRAALGIYSLALALKNADRDNDGMPDLWERRYGLNALLAADASLDPDNDGASNLAEYQQGTDPNVADGLKLTPILENGMMQIEFVASSNTTYVVQYSTILAGGAWTTLARIPPQPYSRAILLLDSIVNSAPGRYYRVQVNR